MAFDGIVLSRVCDELQILQHGRIQRVYMISKFELLLIIRSQGKNHQLLISIHPSYARVQLTYLQYPKPDFPNALTMLLRKHLEGSFIESIEQIGVSRILKIKIAGTNEFKDRIYEYIYIEIMGKHSNFILTNEDNKVIDCLKRVTPSESKRYMSPGVIYDYPPMLNKKNPFESISKSMNYVKDYDGFSKDLSQEALIQDDLDIFINDIKNSHSLYITESDNKEYYHIIELKHLHGSTKEYPLFIGLDTFYDMKDQKDRIKQQTSNLERFIKHEYQKNVNKLNKLQQTLFDSKNSEDYRIKGDLLYSYLHLVSKGMTYITVDNYYDNTTLTIELDPRFDGKQNAKNYYHKYNKAKNALKVLDQQIHETEEEINYFDTLLSQLQYANYEDAIEMKEELENLGYIRKKKVKSLKKKKHPHYHKFITKDDIIIYVGKNNLQNDYLTFKLSKRDDMWFHAKDMPGSHVIVHSHDLDEYTIRLAAKIAAYYSKGQLSSSVPVNYTEVKSLKKPTGNKPGMVLLGHYNTIYIDPDDSFLDEVKKVDD